MEKGLMKNIAKAEVLRLADEVQYQQGQIVSKTLVQNLHVSLTLFAFEKGETRGGAAPPGQNRVKKLRFFREAADRTDEHICTQLVVPALA